MLEPYEIDGERIITDYVRKQRTPCFFSNQDDEELAAVHTVIQRGIEAANESVTIDLPLSLINQLEEIQRNKGWTLEEACNLFLYWYQKCPDAVQEWKARQSISSGQMDEQMART